MLTPECLDYRTLAGGRPPTSPWRFLWLLVRRRFLGRTILLNITAAGGIALMGLESVALRNLTDTLTANRAGGWTDDIVFWVVALGGLWIGSAFFNRARDMVDIYTAPALRFEIQSVLFSYLMEHSPRYFQDNFAGKLGQKIIQAGQAATQLLNVLSNDIIRITTILAMSSVLLASAQAGFGLMMVVWTIGYLLVAALLARRCMQLSEEYSEAASTTSGRMVDIIANAELVRAFARAAHERKLLSDVMMAELERNKRLRWFITLMWFTLFKATLVFQITLITVAASQVVHGRMTPGDFMMVFSLANIVGLNVFGLSSQMIGFFEHLGTLSSALELVLEPHEIADPPAVPRLNAGPGAISVRGLRFAHADGTVVFDGLDLEIRPGEKIALVGPSGAGKSTLVRLLRHQFKPQAGTILIDGRDISRVSLDSLNEAIAEVPQAPGLFHRPIRDNIGYARLEAGETEIIAAATNAHCHEFIIRRPEGYDVMVGEQGVRLSGGERQRVAIARAFLKNAPILVLDEATSALDSETEQLIQEALWRLFQGRTVIAIAHRLSTITGMDRICYMEQGRILEEGGHAELLARNGRYAQLWRCQVDGFLPA